jgi:pilus assembly protein Flp/PilA
LTCSSNFISGARRDPAAGNAACWEEELMLNRALAAARSVMPPLIRTDERGVTALEYGLILALIAAAIVAAVALVGTDLASTFNQIASSV